MCNSVKPATVMSFLNDLYTRLDAMLDAFGVYKVETIGDCYVAAGGLMKVDAETGAAILRAASAVLLPTSGEPVRLRVGIHSGPAMSGVVGTRMPRFCLFGDTINTASRMESTGVPGAIHVSKATRDLTPDEPWEPTGAVEAKGKGLMETYLLKPQNSIAPPPQQQHNHHNHQPV
ncbi:guanylyl and adenylyl cyclase family member [Volvox carteri f. nagariensis]|uniref:Guanylyl and adenylyl cyclase family member n=1 Tax=Volvox carteri f. nagariensis TaxID=3068 RepID=D8U288_VOLCA|nr:guanylyl and adenylyl cyclase family member [Volvox carteri f. nagariensis]EFJ46089.1 guanylyl and adenylyl cyclase family member [Volvox carteri f. nagariensis]|eukprot:XP_002952839.1 guanylyl and adenylyl cyclase family member [Volvox carteri f. nagariensis]